MNKQELAQKYLEKIQNDIDEKIYDLLLQHLHESKEKIDKFKDKENSAKLVKLLSDAAFNLKNNINNYNRLQNYRYIIILCNHILKRDTLRQDIKDLKKEIIEEYTHSEQDEDDKIPLNYQINEIRITYDCDYLKYLADKLFSSKLYEKALYCVMCLRLLEPDDESVDRLYAEIKKTIPKSNLSNEKYTTASGYILALDSNTVIEAIQGKGISYLEKDNQLIITPGTITELKEHMDFQIANIRRKARFDNIDAEAKIAKLMEKYNELIKKYFYKTPAADIALVEQFYKKYLDILEQILMEKMQGLKISKKLRKLAQRDSMLPERGDIQLLAEMHTLSKMTDKPVGIVSNDKDFTMFSKEIFDEFGVKIILYSSKTSTNMGFMEGK